MDGRHRVSSIFLAHSLFTSIEIAALQQLRELLLRQREDMLRGFLEPFFLIVIDVCPLAFGESVYEECATLSGKSLPPEKDDRLVALRSSLPWPGDPLFDDPPPTLASIWPFSARAIAWRSAASAIPSFLAKR
jgi:hypothetical protein